MSKYSKAGVDFDKEHDVVDIFRSLYEKTLPFTKDLEKYGITFPEQGSDFSGGFQINIKKLQNQGIENVVEKECVDGPGSKPIVHALYNENNILKLGCTAIDSIAMSVNDLICSGARPVTLTEYHAWNFPNMKIAKQLAEGNYIGAKLSGATIIGGENASLSNIITGPIAVKAYDMCHIAHGIILDNDLIENPLGKERVKPGDVIIGFSSSGIHCNGVTLAWKTAIDYDNKGYSEAYKINKKLDSLGESVAEALLTPTIIYVKPALNLLTLYGHAVKAIANITGEGVQNIRRVLPEKMGLELDYSQRYAKKPHLIFKWIQENAQVSDKEMYKDYNMGTGMIAIVEKNSALEIIEHLDFLGNLQPDFQKFSAHLLGDIIKDKDELIKIITYKGTEESYSKKD